jgi:hypothetical protein
VLTAWLQSGECARQLAHRRPKSIRVFLPLKPNQFRMRQLHVTQLLQNFKILVSGKQAGPPPLAEFPQILPSTLNEERLCEGFEFIQELFDFGLKLFVIFVPGVSFFGPHLQREQFVRVKEG